MAWQKGHEVTTLAVPWVPCLFGTSLALAVVVAFAAPGVAKSQIAIAQPSTATTAKTQAPQQVPSRRGASVPTESFHVAYGSGREGKDDDDDVSIEVIVSPVDRHIDGIFRMRRPGAIQADISGSYTQGTASSTIVTNLDGYPGYLSCLPGNRGRPVFQNVQIALRIEPGWRSASADVSYSPNQWPRADEGRAGWKQLSGIELRGGVPIHWRGITRILWWSMPGARKAWNVDMIGHCFDSDAPARRRLHLLGTDSSLRQLQTRSEALDPYRTLWSVLNASDRHVLASISCVSQEPGEHQIEQTTLIHPYERLDAFVFPNVPKRVCKVDASHYD